MKKIRAIRITQKVLKERIEFEKGNLETATVMGATKVAENIKLDINITKLALEALRIRESSKEAA